MSSAPNRSGHDTLVVAALRALLNIVQEERGTVIECHRDPKTGGIPAGDDGAILFVARCDEAIRLANEALAQLQAASPARPPAKQAPPNRCCA